MAFILNEEQEVALSEFLNRENKKICEKQILEDEIPKEFRDLIEKTMESGSPLPFFDPLIGYYSVSFTPCDRGERIYAHHHLTGVSEAIYDPSLVQVKTEDVQPEEPTENSTEITGELTEVNVDSDSETEAKDKITGVVESEDGIYMPK
jgi:hypothetical protein